MKRKPAHDISNEISHLYSEPSSLIVDSLFYDFISNIYRVCLCVFVAFAYFPTHFHDSHCLHEVTDTELTTLHLLSIFIFLHF